MKIPFNKPALIGREIPYILDAIRRGQLSGDGTYTRRCRQYLERRLRMPAVLLTPSCTHALELAYLLLDIRPSDEIIVPSFTFPSTVNAFMLRGGTPRFIDIRADTLNMDETRVASAIGGKTRAISPVHYAGLPCRMDVILHVARRHHLPVVEDAAQALGATFEGREAGTFGDLNAFSFHETKNCSCGEGGALALRNAKYIRRAEVLRQKGTNREQFYRGVVDKYSWIDLGSSYLPSELQSAFLLAQLQHDKEILARRRRLYLNYREALQPLEAAGKLHLPVIPSQCGSSYHLFHIVLDSQRTRDRLIANLHRKGITAVFHYFPLHLSRMGRRLGYRRGQFPVTEYISPRLLRLPLYNTMTSGEQRYVVKNILELL
ncbi:MAG TPA: dTDP-4-amino-4,6-dideoxygalactose transaminase [Elusimicrobiota bacterium]|nr:dTDP-4-amino-4,6-dideoxygalactose transaminase [Elusimicrobiota bacterium]